MSDEVGSIFYDVKIHFSVDETSVCGKYKTLNGLIGTSKAFLSRWDDNLICKECKEIVKLITSL